MNGIVFSVVAVFAIVLHFAKYVYGMPSHHCPFDMLWSQYYFVGYLIYALLMIATVSAISTALMRFAGRKESIQVDATMFCKKAVIWNAASMGILYVLLQGIVLGW